MKPAQTFLSLLTAAAVSVGFASVQLIASRTAAVRFQPLLDIVRRSVLHCSRSSSTTRSRSSFSTRKNDDGDGDDSTTTRRTSQTRTHPSTYPIKTTKRTTRRRTSITSAATATASSTLSESQSRSPSETAPSADENKPSGLSAGAAAGIAAGAVAFVAIIAAAAFLLWRRRQGGIRGAVVTADYPQGMSSMSDAEPKMPPPAAGEDGPNEINPETESRDVVEERRPSSMTAAPSETRYKIPPAGTLPGEPGVEHSGKEYPQQQQQWLQEGNLGEARPVSAFGTYPLSPGQPVLPVSPMTPYRPESSILMAGQRPTSLQSRAPSYHPDMCSSPELPAYMIPGGNKSRAISFSSVAHFGGGWSQVAELVGSPPRRSMPSMMVVVEGGSPTRRSHVELP
ncbi:hypothetical protein N657DRAFT_181440 [Parathielavia appendiculata]|uniref:Uncharacterized protein n=1 Tax=Parathielavia appendiculata TaxID=2587402 RepID=A0AAN6Z7B8_9PEZI|nr:hypothetical protein N657DRAFT_181440 [Parathielavia appendiculata]